MNGFLKAVADAVFPPRFTCDLCGREIFDGGHFCKECAGRVSFNDGTTCPVCGRRTKAEGMCLECKAHSPAYDRAVSAMIYEDGGAAVILKFKRGGAYLKDYFAELLAPKCGCFDDADGVCYIPMTRRAERERGYNQAELLAKELAKRLHLPVVNALEKIKDTGEQKSLTRREREDNLRGCFRAERKIVAGRKLILTDDVMTTGATLEEAARILKKRGAAKVYAVTAASVELKREI